MVAKLKASGVMTSPDKFVEVADIYNPDASSVMGGKKGSWDPTTMSLESFKKEAQLIQSVVNDVQDVVSAVTSVKDSVKELESFAEAKVAEGLALVEDAKSTATEYAKTQLGEVTIQLEGIGEKAAVFLDETSQNIKDMVMSGGVGGVANLVNNFGDGIYEAVTSTGLISSIDAATKQAQSKVANLVNGITGEVVLPGYEIDGSNWDDIFGDGFNIPLLNFGLDLGMSGLTDCMESMFSDPNQLKNVLIGKASDIALKGSIDILAEMANALPQDMLANATDNIVGKALAAFSSGSIDFSKIDCDSQPGTPDNTLAKEYKYLVDTMNKIDSKWRGTKEVTKLDNYAAMSNDAKIVFLSDPSTEDAEAAVLAELYQNQEAIAKGRLRNEIGPSGQLQWALQQPGW